jgi:hypothetical protein
MDLTPCKQYQYNTVPTVLEDSQFQRGKHTYHVRVGLGGNQHGHLTSLRRRIYLEDDTRG